MLPHTQISPQQIQQLVLTESVKRTHVSLFSRIYKINSTDIQTICEYFFSTVNCTLKKCVHVYVITYFMQ